MVKNWKESAKYQISSFYKFYEESFLTYYKNIRIMWQIQNFKNKGNLPKFTKRPINAYKIAFHNFYIKTDKYTLKSWKM